MSAKLLMLFVFLGCTAAATWLWDQYTFAVRWPSQVQQEVLGSTVVSYDALISKERSFNFGEGFAKWRYKVDGSGSTLERFCQRTSALHCAFTRSRNAAQGVTLNVELSGGILTVEEWWS
ncbi:hypothetical protein [Sphingomonas sp. Y38-1Y]|uniref:hypothetical protein n=1 Tax=Sphingomonas sp. Y38-1Y TaxID=3078265 RepID=UPI0028E48F07|nr:hypothetical protein [Sphingomonas sp. Y38-1Y]